jgi:hypothetical protein
VRIPAPALEKLWPRLFLLAVLGLFSAVAIHKASLAIAPPVYDSLSYYWKAINSLQALKAGEWGSLMATDPTLRPPGFLLLNGVFGIDRDVFHFHGFFALNMILPVLLWSLACWIAISLRRQTSRLLWHKAVAVAALSLIPMFLQFEYSENIPSSTAWGMQDTVLAASAALAMALVLHSFKHRQILSAAAGFLLSGFTIMIKPAGILVMLSVTGAWVLEAFIRWLFLKSPARRRIYLLYFIKTLLLGVGIQGAIFCAAFFSPYFSKEIIELSVRNQTALVSMNQTQNLWGIVVSTLQTSFGVIWSVVFLAAIPGSAVLLFRSSKRMFCVLWPSLFSTLAILAASFYWWRYMSGTEARYILPFFCMAIILLLPTMWTCWVHWSPSRVRSGIYGLLALLVLLYSTVLAWPGEIPARWQEFLGVNLSTAGHGDSVEAAKFLTQKSQQFDRPVAFLQAEMPYSLAFISAWLLLENLKKEDSFKVDSSFDWKSEKTIPKLKVIHSDFIALMRNPRTPPSEISSLASRSEEVLLLNSWFALLGVDSGIQRHSFGEIELLEVVDRTKFEAAFDALVQSKAPLWRPEFLENNGYTASSWQNNTFARTAFSITGKNLREILVGSRDLEESHLKNLGECVPLGKDPYILLRPFLNYGSRDARFRIQITATAPGALQIFYAGQADAFSEAKSVWLPMNKGFNEVTVAIPLEGEVCWLRIDLSGPPVETTIKKISITLVDSVDIGPRP